MRKRFYSHHNINGYRMSKKLWCNSKCKPLNLFENDTVCNRKLSICWSKIGKSPIFQSLKSSYLAYSLWPQLKNYSGCDFMRNFSLFYFEKWSKIATMTGTKTYQIEQMISSCYCKNKVQKVIQMMPHSIY